VVNNNATTTQKRKIVQSIERWSLEDTGNLESALVLIPLLILFAGIIQLYSFQNAKSAMELVAEGVAASSVSIQNTYAAQFAAQEYLNRPGLPKFVNSKLLEVTVKDEQVTGFVIRKIYLRDLKHSSLIGFSPLQVVATIVLN
jgi:hypothetical protein